jgi:hypothetical protein
MQPPKAIFREVEIWEFDPQERERFFAGVLAQEWKEQYPNLFDDKDLTIALNQLKLHVHFFEWLAAILIYRREGYLSLVEQYQYPSHKRKNEILGKLISAELFNFMISRKGTYGGLQCPDLLVYAPDLSDWYFCEAKGPSDHVRERQHSYFEELVRISGKPIRLIQFRACGY